MYTGLVNGAAVDLQIERHGVEFSVVQSGKEMSVWPMASRSADYVDYMPVKTPPDMSGFLLSPMPGLLVSVQVTPGQSVKAGEVLAVIEAMKMENSMYAERDVVIAKVLAEPGNTLEVDQTILEFEATS